MSETTTGNGGRTTGGPCTFVIFGVTGDLASRKLLPALYRLQVGGELDPGSRTIGFARSELSSEALRAELRGCLLEELDDPDEQVLDDLLGRVDYLRGGYDDADSYARLAEAVKTAGSPRRIFYTATPPSAYLDIASGLAGVGLDRAPEGGFARLVLEKPFGNDLASAKSLNVRLLELFEESQLYRIDHYLAKETAQNLAVLRFANTVFEPLWNNRYIDHVQITMSEDIGVAGRGSFYEQAGVLRDVFQNHLLQLLALVAMEPPARFDAEAVRDEKVKLFRSVTCPGLDDLVLGQYTAGNGEVGYRQEPDVADASRQSTFAALRLRVRNWRFSGTPFYLRSGKQLEAKASEVVLHFRNPPHVPFDLARPLRPDRLILRLVPDEGITLRFNGKRPGQKIDLARVDLDFSYEETFDRPNPDAYETLLLDVMQGDATLFMRADEVEAQWAIFTPLLRQIEAHAIEPFPYPAGGPGPEEAFALLEREDRYWHRPDAVRES
ncbi:MAG TPA: glucose-6-phosphate dehydrogenase [Trueperaceae bacterium]|nr:glucose-6-phosphate dehydrogenase [Trueperaceae bacterium]